MNTPRPLGLIIVAALGLAAALAPTPARADAPLGSAAAGLGARAAVSDSRLGEVRGGFAAADARLSVVVDVRRQVVDGAVGGLGALPAGGLPLGATVLQNAADQQRLQVLTTIDVTANSLQLYRQAGWQTSLGAALTVVTRR